MIEKTVDQILIAGSPWATTGVYAQINGVTDKSVNFIDDSFIAAGTISSAQYRNGMFMFIGMSDYSIGLFDEVALTTSLDSVIKENSQPSGLSYGDYEMIKDGQGNNIRRITNASFAPSAIIDRTVTIADADEFGYTFTANDGERYYVEHKPYASAFSGMTYPPVLQTAVDEFYTAKLTPIKQAHYALKTASPWATTAIYLQVNGSPEPSHNFIDDNDISAGTISSAQYRDGQFIFVGMNNHADGEFDEVSLIPALNAVMTENSQPSGFGYGDYEIVTDPEGNIIRKITNASFAPGSIINRTVTTATVDKFTYTFDRNGNTYYVEHLPYGMAFPETIYPQALQTAIDQFFSLKE